MDAVWSYDSDVNVYVCCAWGQEVRMRFEVCRWVCKISFAGLCLSSSNGYK